MFIVICRKKDFMFIYFYRFFVLSTNQLKLNFNFSDCSYDKNKKKYSSFFIEQTAESWKKYSIVRLDHKTFDF